MNEWSGYGIIIIANGRTCAKHFPWVTFFQLSQRFKMSHTERHFKRQAQCNTGPPSENKTISVLKSWQSCTQITSFQLSYQPTEWILLSICSISPDRELQLWNANLLKVTSSEFQKQKIEAINVTCMSVYHDITHIFLCKHLAYS